MQLEGQPDPIIVSRAKDLIVRDLVQELREVAQSRQQQKILRDLFNDLQQVNKSVHRVSHNEGGLDLDRLEHRIREVIEE